MTTEEAIALIKPGIRHAIGTWADIGAGTGMFTQALAEVLESGKIIALDKSPHTLYNLVKEYQYTHPDSAIEIEIVEADFNAILNLPPLDGIIMANALHYALDPLKAMKNVTQSLKEDGVFILIEYDTETANPPWVPYPVSFERFTEICMKARLPKPKEITRRKSIYSDGDMYVAIIENLR